MKKPTERFELNCLWAVIVLVIIFRAGIFPVDNTPFKLNQRIYKLEIWKNFDHSIQRNEIMPACYVGGKTQ